MRVCFATTSKKYSEILLDLGVKNILVSYLGKNLIKEIKDNKKLDQTIELAEKLPPKPQKEPKITKIPNEKLKLKTIMDLKQINFDHTNPKNKHKMTKMIQSFWGLWKKDKEGCRLRGIYPYRSPDGKWYLCDAGHPLKDKKKKKTTKKVNPKNTLGAFIR